MQSAEGTGIIDGQLADGKKTYRYRVTAGKDPLEYPGTPAEALCGEAYHPAEEWFAATLNTPARTQ